MSENFTHETLDEQQKKLKTNLSIVIHECDLEPDFTALDAVFDLARKGLDSEWRGISSAPLMKKIDVFVWDINEKADIGDGYRFSDVKIVEHDPHIIAFWDQDRESWEIYPLHENGQFASHWMPLPTPPERG